jgi:hypothetical protein
MRQKTTIYLDAKQMKQLETIKEKTGVPVAEQIRRAIDVYLQKAGAR